MRKQCAVYARASTTKQGDTVEHQVNLLTEFARGRGWEVRKDCIYEDEGFSSTYKALWDRPSMVRLLRDAEAGKFQIVLFKGISRLARDEEEAIGTANRLKAKGLQIISLEENYDSLTTPDIIFNIHASLAKYEAEKIAVRVRLGNIQKSKRGYWSAGKVPIGYKLQNGKLVVDPDSSWIVQRIFDLYLNKDYGLHRIAKELNDIGIPSPGGSSWRSTTVSRILTNPVYMGKLIYNRTRQEIVRDYRRSEGVYKRRKYKLNDKDDWVTVEQSHCPIIEPNVFEQVQRKLAMKRVKRSPNRKYLLSGIAECAKCGNGVIGIKRVNRNKGKSNVYYYYKCSTYHADGRQFCSGFMLPMNYIDEVLIKKVRQTLISVWDENLFWQRFELGGSDIEDAQNKLLQIEKKIVRLEKDISDIFEQRTLFEEDTYKNIMEEKKKEIELLRKRRAEAQEVLNDLVAADNCLDMVNQQIDHLFNLNIDDLDDVKFVLEELMDRVILDENRMEIIYKI